MAITAIETIEDKKGKAFVVTRSSRRGGEWIFPERIYLVLSHDGNIPDRFLRTGPYKWVRCGENKRATKRMRELISRAKVLADMYNKGEMSWECAADEFIEKLGGRFYHEDGWSSNCWQ